MHHGRVIAFDEVRFVTVSVQQRLQFFMRDAGEDGGICDLVAVQMQHRQDGPIANRIQKFVRMPRGGQGARFRFAVTHNDEADQGWMIEDRTKCVRQAVAQFPAFMDGTGRLRSARSEPGTE